MGTVRTSRDMGMEVETRRMGEAARRTSFCLSGLSLVGQVHAVYCAKESVVH